MDWLFNTVFSYDEIDSKLELKQIRKPERIKRVFIDKVMASSYEDSAAYTVMCSYIISAINNKLRKIFFDDKFNHSDFNGKKNVIFTLMDIAFHLFNVSPTSTSSLNLSSICYQSYTYFEKLHFEDMDLISLEISKNVKDFFSSGEYLLRCNKIDYCVPIEFLNILCISRITGSEYLLSESQYSKTFNLDGLKNRATKYLETEDSFDYFQIMSALFYSADEKDYSGFVERLSKEINLRLENLNNIKYDSRLCYLFLDSMSCPYIDLKRKKSWLNKFEKIMFNKNLEQEKSDKLFEVLTTNTWFICWDTKIVLKHLLENKKLLFGY
jgi:hypothetical protein